GVVLLAPAAVALVSGVSEVPSVLIVQMFETPLGLTVSVRLTLRVETNTIRVRSGEIWGRVLSVDPAVVVVSGVRAVPSALTRQMLDTTFGLCASVPSRLRGDEKTSPVPSGNQTGETLAVPAAVVLVTGASPVPSALTRHTFEIEFRLVASVPSSFLNETK